MSQTRIVRHLLALTAILLTGWPLLGQPAQTPGSLGIDFTGSADGKLLVVGGQLQVSKDKALNTFVITSTDKTPRPRRSWIRSARSEDSCPNQRAGTVTAAFIWKN